MIEKQFLHINSKHVCYYRYQKSIHKIKTKMICYGQTINVNVRERTSIYDTINDDDIPTLVVNSFFELLQI